MKKRQRLHNMFLLSLPILLETFIYVLWCVGMPLVVAAILSWSIQVKDRLRLTWNAYQHEKRFAKWQKACGEYYVIGQLYTPIEPIIMRWDETPPPSPPGEINHMTYTSERND